jgi:hypothetical protein
LDICPLRTSFSLRSKVGQHRPLPCSRRYTAFIVLCLISDMATLKMCNLGISSDHLWNVIDQSAANHPSPLYQPPDVCKFVCDSNALMMTYDERKPDGNAMKLLVTLAMNSSSLNSGNIVLYSSSLISTGRAHHFTVPRPISGWLCLYWYLLHRFLLLLLYMT